MIQNTKWRNIAVLYQNQQVSTKSDRRVRQIVENATELIAKMGYENLDFAQVAKKCKITRPLISHYFPTKETLLLAVVQFVALEHQKFLLKQLPHSAPIREVLRSYILANLDWPKMKTPHAKVWMHYLALTSFQASEKSENTRSVDNGTQRIWSMLQQGAQQKEWEESQLLTKARSLQLMITGAVISIITEERTEEDWKALTELTLKNCGLLLGTDLSTV